MQVLSVHLQQYVEIGQPPGAFDEVQADAFIMSRKCLFARMLSLDDLGYACAKCAIAEAQHPLTVVFLSQRACLSRAATWSDTSQDMG